jgi:hypothetical protein
MTTKHVIARKEHSTTRSTLAHLKRRSLKYSKATPSKKPREVHRIAPKDCLTRLNAPKIKRKSHSRLRHNNLLLPTCPVLPRPQDLIFQRPRLIRLHVLGDLLQQLDDAVGLARFGRYDSYEVEGGHRDSLIYLVVKWGGGCGNWEFLGAIGDVHEG